MLRTRAKLFESLLQLYPDPNLRPELRGAVIERIESVSTILCALPSDRDTVLLQSLASIRAMLPLSGTPLTPSLCLRTMVGE